MAEKDKSARRESGPAEPTYRVKVAVAERVPGDLVQFNNTDFPNIPNDRLQDLLQRGVFEEVPEDEVAILRQAAEATAGAVEDQSMQESLASVDEHSRKLVEVNQALKDLKSAQASIEDQRQSLEQMRSEFEEHRQAVLDDLKTRQAAQQEHLDQLVESGKAPGGLPDMTREGGSAGAGKEKK